MFQRVRNSLKEKGRVRKQSQQKARCARRGKDQACYRALKSSIQLATEEIVPKKQGLLWLERIRGQKNKELNRDGNYRTGKKAECATCSVMAPSGKNFYCYGAVEED